MSDSRTGTQEGLERANPPPAGEEVAAGGPEAVASALARAAPGAPPPSDPRARAELPRNDRGNAQRLLALHGHDLAVVEEEHRDLRDGWRVWDGRRWAAGGAWAEARLKAHDTAEAIAEEVEALRDDPDWPAGELEPEARERARQRRLEAHGKWAIACGNAGRIDAMLKTAVPWILRARADFDADPWRLTVRNGTLVLREDGSCELQPCDRADYITHLAAVAHRAGADAPRWRAFLEEVQPDPELRDFLQRLAGYCLTGDIMEQKIFCFYGGGANGKSVFVSILQRILGDYSVTLPFHSFAADERKRGGDATPDLARLPGKRLVVASEPEVGTRLSESVIKTQASGEVITARPLFGNQIEFWPSHKNILSFNNRPKITGLDHGTWRRVVIVPWLVRIPDERQDPQLAARVLREEAEGVLQWMLDGYRMWRERGLEVPEAARAAGAEYRDTSDPLAGFFEDVVLTGEAAAGRSVQAARLYEAYELWCRANGLEAVSATRFGRLLPERGLRRVTMAGRRFWEGIDLDEEVLANLDPAQEGQDPPADWDRRG